RRVSKFKKAVDHKRGARPGQAPIAPQAAVAGAHTAPGPSKSDVQPVAAVVNTAAPPRIPGKGETEVLAVSPSAAVQNAVQEGKIHSTKETIKNCVRSAEAKMANIVPVKRNNMVLSPAEVEAFRADYGVEKSFRADYANIMMLFVSYHARMI